MNEEFINAEKRFKSLTEGRIDRGSHGSLFVDRMLHTQPDLYSRLGRRISDSYDTTRKMLRARTERMQRNRRHSRKGTPSNPRNIMTSPLRKR